MATDRLISFQNNGVPLTQSGGFCVNPVTNDTSWAGSDFRNAVLSINGTGNVVVYGSIQKKAVNFTAASSDTNQYAPITLADYSLIDTYYAGAAGVTVAGETKIVELNTNVLSQIGIKVVSGSVSVILTSSDNQ